MRQGRSSEPSPSWQRALVRLRYEVAALRFEMKLARLVRLMRKYDPSQPRVPAGQPGGGQWTSGGPGAAFGPQTPPDGQTDTGQGGFGGRRQDLWPADRPTGLVQDTTGQRSWESFTTTRRADGSIAQQWVINRDGSKIFSEFSAPGSTDGWDQRRTVFLPDGNAITYETSGNIQTIKDSTGQTLVRSVWGPDGPQSDTVVQTVQLRRPLREPPLAPFPGPPDRPPLEDLKRSAVVLFTWLAAQAQGDSNAVLGFPGHEYRPNPADPSGAPLWVDERTDDEIRAVCPRYDEVQWRTNIAAAAVDAEGGKDLTPQKYGTAVHAELAQNIRALNDPNFRAEVSLIKSTREARYGERGSIRIDVMERVDETTVCVYDIKTGNAYLDLARMNEIYLNVQKRFPGAQRIIVTEVRPPPRR